MRPFDITRFEAVIFDFDGPMCSVFAGLPAPTVAAQLRQTLLDQKWARIPDLDDPLQLVVEVNRIDPVTARIVEAQLQTAEIEAVETAIETGGLRSLLSLLSDAEIPVAIVSNNSGEAIRRWLKISGLADEIQHVYGRQAGHLETMKPSPALLQRTGRDLAVAASQMAFIGDSPSDEQAAAATGIPFIGYANKTHKRAHFGDNVALVVAHLDDLAITAPSNLDN